MANNKRPLICLLAAAESSPAVLYGLYDILSSVGVAYPDMTTGVHGDELLDIRIVADTKAPFRCFGNVLIEPHAGIDEIGKTDVIIVSDLYTPIDASPRGLYPREVEWMQKMYANNAVLASVCVGSAVLAETGLLDGLESAGHWSYRHMFRKYYPQIKWREDSILNLAAKGERIITAGGGTSWQDLALYLIAQYCGIEHAIYTAKIFLLSSHSDGQLPFSAMTQYYQHDDAVIGECQTWITENYACANPVTTMADRSGLQARTFARRFRAATGYQPLNYVQDLRIEAAKSMLETGSTAVDDVSAAVGYEDPSSFRRLFKRKAGLTPAIYRKKFAAITQGLLH